MACIGLGMMGGPMAARMAANGYAVHGVDLRPDALDRLVASGGHAAGTPAQAARGARFAVIVVHNAEQADAVLSGPEGLLATLQPGAAVWLACTVGPDYARALARTLDQRGILMLDGPVSGGVAGARTGTLSVLAGGSNEAAAALGPLMSTCAMRVHHVGEAGTGSAVKMINQVLVASHIALAAEALALGQRTGVDLQQLVRAVRDSSGNSVMFDKRALRMVNGDHEPQATVGIFLKDLDIALHEAGAVAQAMPMARAARHVFASAQAQGLAAASDTRLFDIYRQLKAVQPSEGASS
ncbi:NAD(P)-dependent oxidoreductase [Bordetella sp. BOR01]|uniref:NAD(P)-dependent oxidoreductase n=1 Tax=Bordetella sp. BOR01 TaxID=2854779 RepID=UPI001C48B25F|nr:NAD(P)-dependent oxidoreductase [Bordetella sp. BOR01]